MNNFNLKKYLSENKLEEFSKDRQDHLDSVPTAGENEAFKQLLLSNGLPKEIQGNPAAVLGWAHSTIDNDELKQHKKIIASQTELAINFLKNSLNSL